MRRPAVMAAALVALAAAACDESPPSEPAQPIKIANPHHDQLVALSPDMQRLGLMRAIRDNGNNCRRVDAARYQEGYRQMAMWVALCEDGRHWGVFIAPNGDTQVRPCADMHQLRLPQCRPIAGPGNPSAEENASSPGT